MEAATALAAAIAKAAFAAVAAVLAAVAAFRRVKSALLVGGSLALRAAAFAVSAAALA